MRFEYNPKNTFYTFYIRKSDKFNHMLPYKCGFGSLILEFLDLDFNLLLKNFPYDFYSSENICYEIRPNNMCTNYLAQINNRSMLYVIVEQANQQYLKYYTTVTSKKAIPYKEHISDFFATLKQLQEDFTNYLLTGKIEDGSMISIRKYGQNINVSFFFDEDTGEMYSEYEINDIHSVLYFDLINCLNKKIIIKQCENCHKFFIPTKRSDEIYCDRLFKNQKTCKEVGYSEKIKDNAFMLAYTKARKTQHARIRYNKHISDYKEKHYEPWRIAAEKARDEFQAANDIKGFEKWLNEHKNSF